MGYLKAIFFYEKAAEKDHEDALYRLAQIYHHGKGTERNYQKAYDLYTRAANLGHTLSLKILDLNPKQKELSHKKTNGDLCNYSCEIDSSIPMLEFVAHQNDSDLQFKLGYFYEKKGGNQNYSVAFKWYKMAADNNHTDALYRLGLLYENGLGAIQDYSKSLQLYNKAKDQGSHYALYRLGIAFHHGYGTDRNSTKAIDCYTKAAKMGIHESQYTLGKLYETGKLVQRDLIKALILYTGAYMNGNIDVISDLYSLYDDQSYENFFHQKLFQILANFEKNSNTYNNHFRNMYGYVYYKLGSMYLGGIGTEKSDTEALKRFLIAENQYEYSDAKKYTAIIYDEIKDEKDAYIKKMQAYFEIKDTLSSEQQYEIGMVHYNDAKCLYEEDPTKKSNTTPLFTVSKNDNTAYQYMLLASKNNHTKAQYQLGTMYLLGYGVLQDEDQALIWFEKYVEAIDSKQCYKQGLDFYNGNGVRQSYEVAFVFMRKAIKEDNPEAQHLLGLMYLYGLGTKRKLDEAIKWLEKPIQKMKREECYKKGMEFYKDAEVDKTISFMYIKKASERNHIEAQKQLVIMYLKGYGFKQNYREAVNCLERSAKTGSSSNCYQQGMKFYEGNGVDKNHEIAFIYIEKAAQENHGKAQAHLGNMYLQGHGVEQNYEEAINWFQLSIERSNKYECYTIGMNFYQGITIDKSYEIAYLFIIKAIEKGHHYAQVQLALCYFHGYGVEQNHKEAMKWIQISSKELNSRDCYERGMHFYKGDVVAKNYNIAFVYIKQAAESGSANAQAQLGAMYFHGYGVNKNRVQAIQWIEKTTSNMNGSMLYSQGMKFYNDSQIDDSLSLIYLKKAAEVDHRDAQAQLDLMYVKGINLFQPDSIREDYILLQADDI